MVLNPQFTSRFPANFKFRETAFFMADQTYIGPGEFELIETMQRLWSASGVAGDMGDDAAVLPQQTGYQLVVTTDMLIEGRHYNPEWSSWEDIGYKSIAVNLSDIAAMGARPRHVFLSLGLTDTSSAPEPFAKLINGIGQACKDYSCTIDGGDTTRSGNDTIISVMLTGEAKPEQIKYRKTAESGDIIAVTGTLGDAAAALELLDQKAAELDSFSNLCTRHHRPSPRVTEGVWLGGRPEVNAMMDLSDGLAGDLRHIANRSNCGGEIFLDKLPISEQLTKLCRLKGWNAPEIAAAGGDDYELLFTVNHQKWDSFQQAAQQELNNPVTPIGKITDQSGEISFLQNGKKTTADFKGFDHFNPD